MRWLLALLLLTAPVSAQIGPAPAVGNAYAGRCSLNGDPLIMPGPNWSCARWGVNPGQYQINFPSGYNASNYAIVVSISGNFKGIIQSYAASPSYYYVSIFDLAGNPLDATFGFVVTGNR